MSNWTEQICKNCESQTGRGEDDSLYADDDREIGPLCVDCWEEYSTKCFNKLCPWKTGENHCVRYEENICGNRILNLAPNVNNEIRGT